MSTNINNTKAIVLILLGMTVFAIQDTLIKLTSDKICFALSDISFKLPIGVETIYKIPHTI
mgnify:CR=1 FL=1